MRRASQDCCSANSPLSTLGKPAGESGRLRLTGFSGRFAFGLTGCRLAIARGG